MNVSRSMGHIVPFLFLMMLVVGVASTRAVPIYGVTVANQLVRFDSAAPGTVATIGSITGLQSSEAILGIDFRPATGQLFALGSSSRLYTINKITGAASLVGVLSTPLVGADFGFDFNPSVDRIRVVSSAGQNLRVNPTNAAVTVDFPLNPGFTHVTSAAYTNSFNGSASTTLYVIDTVTDTLLIQNPPNNGTLTPVGPLNVNAADSNGFDISASAGIAYAAFTSSGDTALYTINLMTGVATPVGPIGNGSFVLRAMAVESGSAAPNLTTCF